MDAYLQKAQQNMSAADYLLTQDQSLHIAAVHPAYYAYFQLVKYILAQKLGIDYSQQDKEVVGKNSHNVLIGKLKEDIQKNHNSHPDVFRYMATMKQFRTSADYKNTSIAEEDLTNFFNQLNELLKKFEQFYNIQI